MRRVIAVLVVALLSIALLAPTAQAAASAPRAEAGEASGPWWEEPLAAVWWTIAGSTAGQPGGSTASDSANEPDLGPTMDPNG
jgi:hypothetical protein